MITLKESKVMHGIILVILIMLGALSIVINIHGRLPFFMDRRCDILAATGIYCFGCGGTRSVIALLQFHFLESFVYYPPVPLAFLFMVYEVIRNNRFVLQMTGKSYRLFQSKYLFILLGMIVVQAVLKNVVPYEELVFKILQ